MNFPRGYKTFATNCGIKDKTLDLGLVVSEVPANAAALFTQNKFPGEPVVVGKKHIKDGKLQAVIVNSKNANVATGKEGYQIAVDICKKLAKEINIKTKLVLPSSTGVIGRRLPVEKVLSALDGLEGQLVSPPDFELFAKSIMTTDTVHKIVSKKVGRATIVGVAKGSGMIEPGMATMLSYFFTDAKVPKDQLKKALKAATEVSFNSLSVDSDTSTSDTVAILANGLAGKVKYKDFTKVLTELAIELTRKLARDGEGATKLFIVDVKNAHSKKDARRIGKSIINSPLVKTAIYKGDPNWGRITMAVGKTPGIKIKPAKMKILWGKKPRKYGDDELDELSKYLQTNEELYLTVDLGSGKSAWRVYGCDLTEEYVKINAYYTT